MVAETLVLLKNHGVPHNVVIAPIKDLPIVTV